MMRVLLAAFILIIASPAIAGEAPAWRPVDEETGAIRDVEGLEQLAKDFPDSGTIRLRMLQPYLEADEVEKVMETLEWLYDRSYVFSDVAQAQISKLLEGVDPGRIAERLIAEPEVIAASEVVAIVPAEAGLLESVLMDLDGGNIAVTSVSGKSVWGRGAGGKWSEFRLADTDNLSGIGYQRSTGRIWVTSGHIDGSSKEVSAFSGLISPDLGQGEIRVSAADGVALSDMHIAADGAIFASDPVNGGVYVKRADSDTLEELVAPGTFRSPQGLATSKDGTQLYISDYRYGIAILDLEGGTLARLASDIPVIIDGVDALWRRGNSLIAVQNGTSPVRITAFDLSEDGQRVIGQRILEQANPEWTEPLSGYHGVDGLYYIGNGQWEAYVAGELGEAKELVPAEIRHLPIASE